MFIGLSIRSMIMRVPFGHDFRVSLRILKKAMNSRQLIVGENFKSSVIYPICVLVDENCSDYTGSNVFPQTARQSIKGN